MADGTLKVGTITTSSGSGTITIPNTVTVAGAIANTPAFEAKRSANQTASAGAFTKMELNTVLYNTGDYDNSTYKFTPTVAGKYYVYINAYHNPSSTANLYDYAVAIYKNGSEVHRVTPVYSADNISWQTTGVIGKVIEMNGTTDYLEMYLRCNVFSGSPKYIGNDSKYSSFGAYRIGS